jgi:AmmeMemoRadiSam system protein A
VSDAEPPHDMTPLTPEERRLLIRLARGGLAEFLQGHPLPAPGAGDLTPALTTRRATFVTLRHRSDGRLRGCRGETGARRRLVDSVLRNTVASATDDPRFRPVTVGEVDLLTIHVSVLGPLEPIRPEQVELDRHGLYLIRDGRAGLLLPEVPRLYGLGTVTDFLEALCRKAGLDDGAWREPECQLFGFETEHWGDDLDPRD